MSETHSVCNEASASALLAPVTTPSKARFSPHSLAVAFILGDGLAFLVPGAALALAHVGGGDGLLDWQKSAIIFAICAQLVLARNFNLYSTSRILDLRYALRRAPLTFLITFAAMLAIAVATKTAEIYSRLWFFSWALSSLSLTIALRCAAVSYARRALSSGAFVSKALSVGVFCEPVSAAELARQSGREVRLIASTRFNDIGEIASLAETIARDEIDHIYISAPWADVPLVMRHVDMLRHLSTRVFIVAENPHLRANVLSVSLFGEHLALCAAEESIHGWSLWLKRSEDIVLSLCAIVALSPVFVATAAAIRLETRGPIFFRQTRVGFNGRPFQLYKFRSMYADKTDAHASVQTSRNDPRVTFVGRFIRRTSIDELPQFFNVLEGSMSIVGPRPHALMTKTEGRDLNELVAYYAVRHRVKPGMTGWAQVHGFRGELDSIEKLRNRVDYDIDYIDNWSIWIDLRIVWRTILLVFGDQAAY